MQGPSGTVTFLFTDVEGSTRLWEAAPGAMRAALERHDAILRQAFEAHGGYVFATGGDAFSAAFPRASEAVAAALDSQAELSQEEWPEEAHIAVRMGLHTGEANERDGDYFGSAVNRAARVKAIAHGGQILCSEMTAGLVDGDVTLADLGQHRLRDLSAPQRVFQVGTGVFPPLRTIDAFPGNLPLQVSSFVGREKELARTANALSENRVVTLTGVGGVGKTRLALQVAAEVLPRFSDGAWLCELAPLRDPAGVSDAIAALFDVVPRGGQTLEQALEEFLRGKEILLVLDNCEHLLQSTALLVELLERSCPRLVVLATSREGLGIDGERMLVVPSLSAPGTDAGLDAVADADAVRLFLERGQAVKGDFTLTEENAASVGQLCRRLDGIPLAIELAAARVPAMNPGELARRLDRRFEVLAGGRRGAIERHQTLRAAIDWSYELATEPQRRLLARLTVFAGGCTLEAVELVCEGTPVEQGEAWELMASLVSQSLVVAEDYGLDTRYRLLETIRQYGEERLEDQGETEAFRRRHARYYADLTTRLGQSRLGPDQVESGARLAAEQENILRAVNFAVDTEDVDLAFKILLGIPSMNVQGGFGFQPPPEPALALPGASDHQQYPSVLAIAAGRAAGHGETDRAQRLLDEAAAAAVRQGIDPEDLFDAWNSNARILIALNHGDWHEAAVEAERTAERWRSHGRLTEAAAYLISAAQSHAMAGDPEVGLPLATQGLTLARQVGMPYLISLSHAVLANALVERDPGRAKELLCESLELVDRAHYETSATQVTVAVLVAGRLRDIPFVLELAPRALRLLHWNGDRPQLGGVLNVVAWAVAETAPAGAAMLQGAARRLMLDGFGVRTGEAEASHSAPRSSGGISDLRRETTQRLVNTLGDQQLRDRRAEGEALDPDEAVELALSLSGHGDQTR